MTGFTVSIDRSETPARLDFSEPFNVAVPFIDRHVAEGRAGKIAIRTADGETVSHGQLAERVNRCGNALRAADLAPGDRLLMVVRDCPAFFYLFWGAIKAGFVPVPVNTMLRAADYRAMIERSGCAALCYSPDFSAEVEPALDAADHRPKLLWVEDESLGDVLAAASPELAPAPARAEDDCFWLFSSGSTGRPKAAVHRHRDMVATSEYYGVGCLGIAADDVFYSAAKLFFAYGLGNAMTFPLWVGGTAVLDAARPTPESTFALIERFRPTLYFGVPTLYAAQLQAMETATPDLGSLRACVSAGEALPGDLLRRWRDATNLDILDGIGSTEALHIFITNRAGDITPGASGRVVPGFEAKIVNETGAVVVSGEAGRLLIRGPSTARAYWREPERTAQVMQGDWLDTGDTYRCDDAGVYVYGGRSDDMMKVGGIWCSPFEIEARLCEHPAVLEAAVVGRADDAGLIKPAAFVVPAGEARATLVDDLIAHVKVGLAPYKYPRWITLVDELPKTATGKIQRFKLRDA